MLAVVLAGIAVLVGWRTRGFALFGAAVFLAVVVFGTVRTLVRTADHPRVQAVALLRTGRDYGFTGYYISETNDRVYLARIRGEEVGQGSGHKPEFKRSTPRIVVLPRSSVVSLLIGPSQSIRAAYDEGDELLHELCMAKVSESGTTTPVSTGGRPAVTVNPCPPR